MKKVRCYKCDEIIAILPDSTAILKPLLCSKCHSNDVGDHNHDEECPHMRGPLCEECIQNKGKNK